MIASAETLALSLHAHTLSFRSEEEVSNCRIEICGAFCLRGPEAYLSARANLWILPRMRVVIYGTDCLGAVTQQLPALAIANSL